VSDLPEPLRARVREQNAEPAIDVLRGFLGFKVAYAGSLAIEAAAGSPGGVEGVDDQVRPSGRDKIDW
jgi:hypothetical protein